jgi:hypothetical protein
LKRLDQFAYMSADITRDDLPVGDLELGHPQDPKNSSLVPEVKLSHPTGMTTTSSTSGGTSSTSTTATGAKHLGNDVLGIS